MASTTADTQEPARPKARRLGPRPLPLHLSVAATTWVASRAAWPFWKNASPCSNGSGQKTGPGGKTDETASRDPLAERSDALRRSLADVDPERFAAALDRAIAARSRTLLSAIERYRHHSYRRELTAPPALWTDGPARLLDYGTPAGVTNPGTPLLVVPSLINRAYVLDLSRRCSLLRWFAAEGFRPLLLDWGAPDADTRRFTLTDYVAGTLDGALDAVLAETGRAPLLLGYCMGGLLALALAQRRQRDLAGLALMATPWDFAAGGGIQGVLARAALVGWAPALEFLGELPVDAVQALFASLDPELGVRKFLAFARLDPESERAEDFVALEDWLNDGIPLAAPVARECLGGWYGENTPARGLWRIAGRTVDPAAIDLPSLVLVPAQDRIVPPASALALGETISGAEICRPSTGHIGMVVSRQAPETVWRPLAEWLRARG